MSRDYYFASRRAVDRLDVLEPPRSSLRGCNALSEVRERCGKLVVEVRGGTFGERRLCREHASAYRVHDNILRKIRDIVSGMESNPASNPEASEGVDVRPQGPSTDGNPSVGTAPSEASDPASSPKEGA